MTNSNFPCLDFPLNSQLKTKHHHPKHLPLFPDLSEERGEKNRKKEESYYLASLLPLSLTYLDSYQTTFRLSFPRSQIFMSICPISDAAFYVPLFFFYLITYCALYCIISRLNPLFQPLIFNLSTLKPPN